MTPPPILELLFTTLLYFSFICGTIVYIRFLYLAFLEME